MPLPMCPGWFSDVMFRKFDLINGTFVNLMCEAFCIDVTKLLALATTTEVISYYSKFGSMLTLFERL